MPLFSPLLGLNGNNMSSWRVKQYTAGAVGIGPAPLINMERFKCVYVYMCVCVCVYIYVSVSACARDSPVTHRVQPCPFGKRRAKF